MKRIFLVFSVCVLLASCTPATPTTIQPPTSIPVSPFPLATSTKTLSTQVPTATFSPTPIATLSADEARARLLELLANNGNCQLPCLWGITPGKSTYQEARTILLPLNSISDSTHLYSSSPDDISPAYTEGDLMLRTFVAYLYADDSIVSRIAFQSRELKKIITTLQTMDLDLIPFLIPTFLESA